MRVVFSIVAMMYVQACAPKSEIAITEFSTLNQPIDTTRSLGRELIYYNNFFLVANYAGNAHDKSRIDRFVIKYLAKNVYAPDAHEIRLYFYKETDRTNLAVLKQNLRELDRYSNENDLIYFYSADLKGNLVWEKYRAGELIETNEFRYTKPDFKIKKVED